MNQQKDKLATIQVLGCLMKRPMLLLDERYRLCIDDFPERFHQILFGAIDNLIKNGVQEIDCVNIDNYLSKYPRQYKVFCDNRGIEYIANAVEMAQLENFDYYYSTLRKFGLLNQLQKYGFDTTLIYDPNILDVDQIAEMQRKFDECTIADIFNYYERGVAELKETYDLSVEAKGCQAASGMKTLKEQYKEAPEMGMPMGSAKLTTITRGRRLKKLYMKTSPSGFGKTRISAGDAACISIPWYYDTNINKWTWTGYQAATLFITTELEIDEIQTLWMAYVSGVPEDHILDGKYADDEEERVNEAIKKIEESQLYIEHIPNFNIEDVENVIKKYKIKHQIGYVFFDYIFTSIKILSEVATKTRGVKMREDNVLLMFADRMKSLANSLNIHIDTSSQANGDWKTTKDGDQNLIRGAKAIADKLDVGIVVLPVTEADKVGIESIVHRNQGFLPEPNLVYHIYKNRRSRINHVKLWVYFDYSTCRVTDLFVTDNQYNQIDVESTRVDIMAEPIEDVTAASMPMIQDTTETDTSVSVDDNEIWF